MNLKLLSALIAVMLFGCATLERLNPRLKQNDHLIDVDDVTGFKIYRVSEPSADDMKEFCRLGIQEIMVLSGDGELDEALAAEHCPTLKVAYNLSQRAKVPLDADFLAEFDRWVSESRAAGKRIAFRCHCGCHRTGRLAAYYQMKYLGYSAAEANRTMKKLGKWMFVFPYLDDQVRALEDYVHGRPCSENPVHCVLPSKLGAVQ